MQSSLPLCVGSVLTPSTRVLSLPSASTFTTAPLAWRRPPNLTLFSLLPHNRNLDTVTNCNINIVGDGLSRGGDPPVENPCPKLVYWVQHSVISFQ